MTLALAAIVAAGILLPHVLRLQRAAPATACVLWLASLALRALTGMVVVTFLLFVLPRTEVFETLTHWCLHAVLPGLADDLNVEGHGIGDLVLVAPGIALGVTLLLACVQTARGAWTTRRLIDRHVLGSGPHGSLIVSGPDVVFAVAGLARPKILVSAGALASLDDAELAAGLDHERGHIAHRHRFVMLTTAALSSLGWMVPGTRRAAAQVVFHLERDADRWALERTNDRLALASVISKAAATAQRPGSPAMVNLGQTGVVERLGQLLDDEPRRLSHPTAAALNLLAGTMVACTLLLAVMLPSAAAAGARGDAHQAHHAHCEH